MITRASSVTPFYGEEVEPQIRPPAKAFGEQTALGVTTSLRSQQRGDFRRGLILTNQGDIEFCSDGRQNHKDQTDDAEICRHAVGALAGSNHQ